jgi:hypothetical protein
MSTPKTCQCGRPVLVRPGDLEPTCAQCRSKPDYCGCEPALPSLDGLLADLADADNHARRQRVHHVIRLLAIAPVEVQQEYRAAIVGAKHISAGDWREALTEAKRMSRLPGQPDQPGTADQAPGSHDALDITDEPAAVQSITAAICSGELPEIYLRGRQLVHIAATDDYVVTLDLDEALLRRKIADHLSCVRQTPIGVRPALPYPSTCKAILALADWPKVPKLTGVVSYPLLLPGGSVLREPGYDQPSGLYLHQGVDIGQLAERPDARQVAAAKSFLLDKYLRDFPWAADADKANYLGALLTPPLREIIGDLFPLIYITAPERGTGKSLLAELVTTLYGGAMRTYPESDGEMRKVITASLRGAEPVIVFDNVEGVIKSPSLAAALTARMWTDRILGGSHDGKWPNDRLWMATGTNVTLGGDHAQRSVRVAIDYGRPDPDQRTGFAIPDIARWTQANRGKVIRAVLILARAWQAAGACETEHVMRGFTRWARVIGGILAYHDVPGFLANRQEIQIHDEDYADWDRFLHMLYAHFGDRPQRTRGILDEAAANRDLADAMPSTNDGGPWTTRTLGKALAAHVGRWYDGLSLTSEEDKSAKIQRWRVRKLDAS